MTNSSRLTKFHLLADVTGQIQALGHLALLGLSGKWLDQEALSATSFNFKHLRAFCNRGEGTSTNVPS